jgi:oligoribonuclease
MGDLQSDVLLFIDLETTGSNVEHDNIIEIGAILTTTNLDLIDDFTTVVDPSDEALGRMMRNDIVREMHTVNGLLDVVLKGVGTKPHQAAADMLNFLRRNDAPEGRTVLAGSGVGHFDRRFIDAYMPPVAHYLRYWCIDVGVIRRAHEMWTGSTLTSVNDTKTHRALDDARLHLEEARAFRDLWQQPLL